MSRQLQLLCLLILSSLPVAAQPPTTAAAGETAAVVTFTLDFPASQPEHYSLRVPAEGLAHYQSTGRLSADSDATDSFEFDFTPSDETRHRIFALATKAGYFQGALDSHHKNQAFTGTKTLSYRDGRRSGESTYNVSANPAAVELTSLFQNLSSTLEFGHRLDYDLRYQKLALDEELKRMQEMAQSSMLIEIGVIHPILEEIVADQGVVNVARARAQRLLGTAGR